MAVLVKYPIGGQDLATATAVLVEMDRSDVSGLTLAASPDPGRAAATATQTLSDALAHLDPLLRTLKSRLDATTPDHMSVEFGVKFGGEVGVILTKGTAEVNLKITISWDKASS